MNIFKFASFPLRVSSVVLLLLLLSGSGNAQQTHPFDLPATLPIPDWVKQVNWEQPNVYKIDSLIHLYENSKARGDDEPLMESEEEEGDFREEPYINAYIRWRNKMDPFIQPDGTIKFDPDYARKQLLESIGNQKESNGNNTAQKTTALSNWTLLGPQQTYKVGTGELRNYQSNIYCIAIAPSNPSVLYAGSEPGTFFRSSDKGLHWVSVSESLYSCGSKSIAVDPGNENIVYTYDGSANQLLKTTTGGALWSVLSSYTGGGGNAIVVNPTTGRVIITGSTAIYYSDDAGVSWLMASGSSVSGTLYDLVLNPTGTDTVYAVGSTSSNLIVLLRSTNGGISFTNVTGAAATIDTKGARLGVSLANSNYLYCINLGNTVPPKLLKSTDRASTWSVVATSTVTGLTGSSVTTGLGMSNGQGFYDLSMVVSPSNENHVIVGTTTTYKSTDGGVNFSPLGGYSGPFGIHPDLQQAVVLGGDTYLATDGGVNYSTDFFTNTANWSVRNNGIRSAEFWGFGQGWDEDIVVGGRYHNGNTAIYEFYGPGNALSLGGGEDATGHVFHGNSQTVGFRDIGTRVLPSVLTGAVMSPAPSVPNSLWPQEDYYGQFSSKLMVDPRYSNVFYLGKDSVLWKSTNSGASYTELHNFGDANKVWRFDIARSNPSVLYVCATNGLYKSIDAGISWVSLSLPATWTYYNTDIAVNPLNENDVYYCMANGSSAQKVFHSVDGGGSWTNITGTTVAGKKVAFLQFHGGTNGGLYAITNNRPSKVYYRDNTMTDWIDFSAGLPGSLVARTGSLLFYRDSKMRLAGNCSVWETPLFAVGAPVAQPMADRKYVGCARDTINYFDYSMYDYAGATRLWSFPGATWVSSTTALKPKVVYPAAGAYTVSLTITNSLGVAHTKTIDSMVVVKDDNCSPDTVAGRCLQMNGTNQTVNLGIANINSNNFSISCWVQPEGMQRSFSQLVSHAPYPGSGSGGFGLGYKFAGYTPNLILCYTDSLVSYTGTSSLVCDSTRWNYVVLTYSPTGVVLYLNGVADTVNTNPSMPVIDLSQSPFYVNYDCHNGQGSRYKGKIEEIKFYDHALTQEEVREKMHIISDPTTEAGLLKYFQFNQYDPVSERLYDMKANYSVPVPPVNIVRSTAPVSSGVVMRNPSVNTAGLNSFASANVAMHLPVSGTYPDGEVVAFHLFSNPDTLPDTRPTVPGYFIINNYGSNQTFTEPDSVILNGLNIGFPDYVPGDFRLFARATGDFGNTWSAELNSASRFGFVSFGSILTFTANGYDTVFNRQYVIVNNDTSTHSVAIGSQQVDTWKVSDLYPNPGREWVSIDVYAPITPTRDMVISISDITGKRIATLSQMLNKGKNTVLIHVPPLSPGSYFLSFDIDGRPIDTRKLVID